MKVFFKLSLIGMFLFSIQLLTNARPSFEMHEIDAEHGKVIVFDADCDGHNDMAKIETGGEAFVLYHYSKSGELAKHVLLEGTSFRGDRIDVGDIDRDGDLDLIAGLNVAEPGETERYKAVWLENPLPDGKPTQKDSWEIHIIGDQDGYIKDMVLADFDGDGKLDVATREHTQTMIHFQHDPTHWSRNVILNHESHEGMGVGDLDLDGDPDIVLNGFWYETPEEPRTGVYEKHVFDPKWFTPIDNSWRDNNAAIKVADVNGDSLPDILISHSELPDFPISVYTAASVSDVREDNWREIQISKTYDFCQTLDAGDFDNDGDIDVLAAKFERDHQSKRWMNEPPYPISVFYNLDGEGTEWKEEILANDSMYAGTVGDVGSDGDMDIVGPTSYWKGPIKLFENTIADRKLALDNFEYIQIDDKRDKRYFGLLFADFTGDGYQEIVTGKWFYMNPGGDMSGEWERTELDENIDALVAVDVDDDEFGDFIALRCNEQYWYEAKDMEGREWKKVQIGSLPICDHKLSTQYYNSAQLIPGGKPEIILAEYYFEIPDNPEAGNWPVTQYSLDGKGYAVGDIDGDGWVDIAGSYGIPGEDPVPGTRNVKWWCSMMAWWKNPGDGSEHWKRFDAGKATHADRFALADVNGDDRLDLITTEERYPGSVPNSHLYWFEQPENPAESEWTRHLIVKQTSMNNLDVADIDRDGDPDIIVCEHKMPFPGKEKTVDDNEKLEIWENDGQGNFTEHLIDTGKESHLGAQLADLDQDGDLDIVSIAWRNYQYLHLWRNDAVRKGGKVSWRHEANFEGDFPMADVGRQAAALVFDIDQDRKDDFVIAGWSEETSMVWFRSTDEGWKRYLVDNRKSHIEAGGAYFDIDGDGDLDILQGGSWATNEVWWWENPYPDFEPEKPWNRYMIKDYGEKQHHDQIFGDFDGDEEAELVFWNQQAKKLWITEIPDDPADMEQWDLHEIWSWPKEFKYEGFDQADINRDGKIDLVGGGRWFTHLQGYTFYENIVDQAYGMSRSAAGDFINGGYPEIVLNSGDGVGPLNLYEWKNGKWEKTTLIEKIDHGHTLQRGDINGDGNLDLYAAEMYDPGSKERCKQYVLYGDGNGNFEIQVLSTGIGTHEGKLGDLDGDGDLDILQKDFQHQQRVDIWWNDGV